MRNVVAVAGLCMALFASAQSFDIEQFDQVFRPRLRYDMRYLPPMRFRDTTGSFSNMEETAVLTFPIRSHFRVSAGLDTNAKSIGELLKNTVRVEASQLLGSLRLGARQIQHDLDAPVQRQLYTASAGVLGLSVTKRFRLRFWSANLNVSEEDRSFNKAVVRVNGIIGWLKLKGLRRYHYYGLAGSFSDGLGIPLPFYGGMVPLGGDLSLQYLLPAQAAVAWRPGSMRYMAGLTLDGFRTGFELAEQRVNLNYAALRLFGNARYRVNHHLTLRAEVGYVPYHNIHYTVDRDQLARYPLQPGVSFLVGVNVLFGQSILERVMDEVLR